MKKYTIIFILIGIILGFYTGIYLYKINQINSNNLEQEIALIEDECTEIVELEESGGVDLIRTNSDKEKASPNCILNLKIYYDNCGHLIEKKEKIKENEVNITEKELKEKFKDWEVQKFTPNEITLYKEVNEYCNEHFLLKEQDGYIAIFKLDQDNKLDFFKITEIPTEYLAEEDLEEIKNGIKIYTKKELNKTLENFE